MRNMTAGNSIKFDRLIFRSKMKCNHYLLFDSFQDVAFTCLSVFHCDSMFVVVWHVFHVVMNVPVLQAVVSSKYCFVGLLAFLCA